MRDWRTAIYYRNRAEILRTIADVTEHADHQRSLRCVADHYDTMAAAIERDVRDKDWPSTRA
jgi:hypothetical protein